MNAPTPEMVLAEMAGEQMDQWVRDHVYPWLFQPSRSLSPFFTIERQLHKRGIYLSIHALLDGYRCEAYRHTDARYARIHHYECWSETLPLAVCRCAVIAVLEMEKKPQ